MDLDKYMKDQNSLDEENKDMSSSALTRPGHESATPIYDVQNLGDDDSNDKEREEKELRDFEDKMDLLLDKITNENTQIGGDKNDALGSNKFASLSPSNLERVNNQNNDDDGGSSYDINASQKPSSSESSDRGKYYSQKSMPLFLKDLSASVETRGNQMHNGFKH